MADNEPQFSLTDIAGISMDDVAEFRYTTMPKGGYTWQVKDASLDTMGGDDIPVAVIECEALEVHGLTGLAPGESEADFLGNTHREVFFLRKIEDLGRVKAFIIDAGFPLPPETQMADMLMMFKSHVFRGRIKHRADKQDKSVMYANITLDRVAADKPA